MRTKEEIIAEIQRVASELNSKQVSQNDFEEHGNISLSGVTYHFGSWNRAIEAAGLEPYESGGHSERYYSDNDMMQEIIRLTRQLRKIPSERELASFGNISPKPFRDRWGTFAKAREATYIALGRPDLDSQPVV